MRFLLLLLWFASSCGNNTAPSATSGADTPPAPAAGSIRFSQHPMVSDYNSPDNWCNAHYTESVPVFPDPANVNRRFFVLGTGLYHIVTTHSQQKTSWLARRSADGGLELFTSDNFPSCLSNRKNFTLNSDGRGFSYDNRHRVAYPVTWQPDNGRISLEFPAESYFGIEVYRQP